MEQLGLQGLQGRSHSTARASDAKHTAPQLCAGPAAATCGGAVPKNSNRCLETKRVQSIKARGDQNSTAALNGVRGLDPEQDQPAR